MLKLLEKFSISAAQSVEKTFEWEGIQTGCFGSPKIKKPSNSSIISFNAVILKISGIKVSSFSPAVFYIPIFSKFAQ